MYVVNGADSWWEIHRQDKYTYKRKRYGDSSLGVFTKYIYQFRIFDSTANGILRGQMKPTGQ